MGCDCDDLGIPDKKDRNRILYPVVYWQTHLKSPTVRSRAIPQG
jgi:hypothetical protein